MSAGIKCDPPSEKGPCAQIMHFSKSRIKMNARYFVNIGKTIQRVNGCLGTSVTRTGCHGHQTHLEQCPMANSSAIAQELNRFGANLWTKRNQANLAEFVEEYFCSPSQVEDDGEYWLFIMLINTLTGEQWILLQMMTVWSPASLIAPSVVGVL